MKVMAAFVFTLSLASMASAEQVPGNYGNVYSIAEEDAIEHIKGVLTSMKKSGQIDSILTKWRNDTLNGFLHPKPLPGISTNWSQTTKHVDPTYTFESDMVGPSGEVMVKAGTRINPLQYVSLGKKLIFVDLRDFNQVALAKRIHSENSGNKIIATAGEPLKLGRELDMPVYFDQFGALTKKLGITTVPSVVEQDGLSLKVTSGRQ